MKMLARNRAGKAGHTIPKDFLILIEDKLVHTYCPGYCRCGKLKWNPDYPLSAVNNSQITC